MADLPEAEVTLEDLQRLAWQRELAEVEISRCIRPPLASLVPAGSTFEVARAEWDALASDLGAPPGYEFGMPGLTSVSIDDALRFDTFGAAALSEMSTAFYRAHQCTLQAFLLALAAQAPPKVPSTSADMFDRGAWNAHVIRNAFLSAWEIAAMRLCGFWDRVGQLLDFVFFNIRQYEHDEFTAVMRRIYVNYVQPPPHLCAKNESWLWLWAYQKSEKESGFKWLQSRRNLVTHRLAMWDRKMVLDLNPLLTVFGNVLDTTKAERLRIGTYEEELERLRTHHDAAARGHAEAVRLCSHAINALGISPARLRAK